MLCLQLSSKRKMGNNKSKVSSHEDTITEFTNFDEHPVHGASKTNKAKVPEVMTTSSDSADNAPPLSKKSGGKKTNVDIAPASKKPGGKKTGVNMAPASKKSGGKKTDVNMAAAAPLSKKSVNKSFDVGISDPAKKSDKAATNEGSAAAPTPSLEKGKKIKKRVYIAAKQKANLEKAQAIKAGKKSKMQKSRKTLKRFLVTLVLETTRNKKKN